MLVGAVAITLTWIFRRIRVYASQLIEEKELVNLTRTMLIFIFGYVLVFVCTIIALLYDYKLVHDFLSYSVTIIASLILDSCTIGQTIYFNFKSTQAYMLKSDKRHVSIGTESRSLLSTSGCVNIIG